MGIVFSVISLSLETHRALAYAPATMPRLLCACPLRNQTETEKGRECAMGSAGGALRGANWCGSAVRGAADERKRYEERWRREEAL